MIDQSHNVSQSLVSVVRPLTRLLCKPANLDLNTVSTISLRRTRWVLECTSSAIERKELDDRRVFLLADTTTDKDCRLRTFVVLIACNEEVADSLRGIPFRLSGMPDELPTATSKCTGTREGTMLNVQVPMMTLREP